ncbi:phage major capsid protein [Gulosibacter sp. 10]|uniref:phage major capsid protein n=1 Tax=Gulosibacter sp. 10 TaxID=1255570 RepID=UPI00097E95D6|nr:phage major capsid protein [Gulosibacter sp. 10]SJM61357.1 Phage capsid and scaffold [Gulosibacter sp. 10]
MPITAPTKTSEFAGFLKPNEAQAYFQEAQKQSIAQSLARKVPLGINGEEIPVVTSKPTAGWVSEGGQKPATSGSLGLKSMKPHKIAAIAVVSAEVVRANPGNYINILRSDIAEAFAIAFDAAALHGVDTPFGQYVAQTTKAVGLGTAAQADGGVYGDVNAALKLLVDDKKKLTGWAFDDTTEPTFNAATDLNGRPLFVDATYEDTSLSGGRLLRRQALYSEGIARDEIVGFAGNWAQAIWGVVGGISYDVSTEATVTINGQLTSLWEHNLVAIRAEAEYGWMINDVESFVKITEPENP